MYLTYSQVRDIEPLKLRYDTADNLRLRKILDPSKPQHAEILTRAGVTSGSGSHAGGRIVSSSTARTQHSCETCLMYRHPKQQDCCLSAVARPYA
jgi:hypothetical protein